MGNVKHMAINCVKFEKLLVVHPSQENCLNYFVNLLFCYEDAPQWKKFSDETVSYQQPAVPLHFTKTGN